MILARALDATRRYGTVPALDRLNLDVHADELLARFGLADLVKRQAGSVVLTSHYLEEIEALARRVVVIGGAACSPTIRSRRSAAWSASAGSA